MSDGLPNEPVNTVSSNDVSTSTPNPPLEPAPTAPAQNDVAPEVQVADVDRRKQDQLLYELLRNLDMLVYIELAAIYYFE